MNNYTVNGESVPFHVSEGLHQSHHAISGPIANGGVPEELEIEKPKRACEHHKPGDKKKTPGKFRGMLVTGAEAPRARRELIFVYMCLHLCILIYGVPL